MALGRPLRSRPLVWVGVAIVAVAIAAGGYGFWYLFLKSGGPPPVSITNVSLPPATTALAASGAPGPTASGAASSAASPSSAASSSAPSSSSAAASSASAPTSASGSIAGVDGTWKVDQSLGSFSNFSDSFVGYRVQEQLASIGANTAVGRTPDVTGTLTIQGTTVTAATFTADLTTLQSDDDRRDGQLRNQGIQTRQFPTSTFKLTSPIDLGAIPPDGQTITVAATGDFTLHGVTKSVQVQLQAKRSSDVIVVTGSMPIVFADYGVQRPTSFAVLSIDDHGTMEFQLLFTRA